MEIVRLTLVLVGLVACYHPTAVNGLRGQGSKESRYENGGFTNQDYRNALQANKGHTIPNDWERNAKRAEGTDSGAEKRQQELGNLPTGIRNKRALFEQLANEQRPAPPTLRKATKGNSQRAADWVKNANAPVGTETGAEKRQQELEDIPKGIFDGPSEKYKMEPAAKDMLETTNETTEQILQDAKNAHGQDMKARNRHGSGASNRSQSPDSNGKMRSRNGSTTSHGSRNRSPSPRREAPKTSSEKSNNEPATSEVSEGGDSSRSGSRSGSRNGSTTSNRSRSPSPAREILPDSETFDEGDVKELEIGHGNRSRHGSGTSNRSQSPDSNGKMRSRNGSTTSNGSRNRSPSPSREAPKTSSEKSNNEPATTTSDTSE